LKLVQAIALKQGWVVPFVEFDPKQADPAKPHLVYRALLSGLRFPKRDDGSQCRGFFDLVGEIRKFWARASQGAYFKMSPWFRITLEALRRHPHCEEQEYLDVCGWLAGEPINYATVKTFCRLRGGAFPPSMPRVRESAEIYVFHLVVLHEICQALGYRGLLLVLDEAEHVRGYNVSRRERASNFFDFLARSSHPPLKGVSAPLSNDHGHQLPPYWNRGPLFGTVVGLTEGDTFTDKSLSLRDACVFLHDETDAVMLQCPSAEQYKNWCLEFLRTVHDHLPESTQLLANEDDRAKLAQVLAEEFQQQRASERTLRLWVKLASLIPSVTMSHNANTIAELANIVRSAARTASGQLLPWEV